MTCKIEIKIAKQEVEADETPYLEGTTTIGKGRKQRLGIILKFPIEYWCGGLCEPNFSCQPEGVKNTSMTVIIPVGPPLGLMPEKGEEGFEFRENNKKCISQLKRCELTNPHAYGGIELADKNACMTKVLGKDYCNDFSKSFAESNAEEQVQAELDALAARLEADPTIGGLCRCVRTHNADGTVYSTADPDDDGAIDFLSELIDNFGDWITENLMKHSISD